MLACTNSILVINIVAMTVFISIDITIKLHCYYLFLLLYHVAI
jgi:hypothetical protein